MKRNDSDSDRDDEVMEVKRAMKEARARKKLLESKMKCQFSRDAQDKSELEIIIRSLRDELDATKSELSSVKYDLKESKFECSQLETKCSKLNEERKLLESVHHAQQLELQLKMESTLKRSEEKHHIISIEAEKIERIAEKLVQDVADNSGKSQMLRTHFHLLEKLLVGITKVKEVNQGSKSSPSNDLKRSISLSQVNASADSSVDSALLDMCRNLEDENITLTETITDLKNQLTEAKREAAASKLIPHYRLAVMRAKTHADNLAEQIQRERQTSQSLREQLHETYSDLKKVVEEKRKLYRRLGKTPLEDDEKLLKKSGVHIAIEPKSSRNSSPISSPVKLARDNSRLSSAENFLTTPMNTTSILENSLQGDLRNLDSQIELIRSQLEKAAALQSQKILSQVVDHSVQIPELFD